MADLLKLSPKTIYQFCQQGLANYKIGGAIRIAAEDLMRFLAERKQDKGIPAPQANITSVR